MAQVNTNLTGIQQPMDEFALGKALSQGQPQTGIQTAQTEPEQPSSSLDLKKELATIQALQKGSSSGGLGKTIGGVGGAGVATALGLPPQAGAVAGQTVGSVVDYMIDKSAREKAEQKRTDALRREKVRVQNKQSSDAWLNKLAESRGIAITEFQEKMDKYAVSKQMRDAFLQQLVSKVASTKARKQGVDESFLESRRLP